MVFPSRQRSRTTTEEQYLLPITSPITFDHPPPTTFTPASPYRPHSSPGFDAPPPKRHSLPAISTSQPLRRETPHDVALLELNARLVGGPRTAHTNKGDAAGERNRHNHHSRLGPFPPTQQDVFDPYTGTARGTLGPLDVPRPGNPPVGHSAGSAVAPGLGGHGRNDNNDGDQSSTGSGAASTKSSPSGSGRENDLWDALARVRVIQSEVAKKHLAMEGLGGVKTTSSGGKSGAPKRRRSSRSSRDKVELEDEFTGRKEAIDEIMKKLDELSYAVKGFHELPSPNANLPPSSRASTNSSFTTLPRSGPISASPYVSYYTTQHSPPVSPTSPRPSHSARSPLPPIIDSTDEFESPRHYYQRSRRSPSSSQASFVNYS